VLPTLAIVAAMLLWAASAPARIISSSQPGAAWTAPNGASGAAVASGGPTSAPPGSTWISAPGDGQKYSYAETFTVTDGQATAAVLTFTSAKAYEIMLNGKPLLSNLYDIHPIPIPVELTPGTDTLVITSVGAVAWTLDASSYVALGDAYAAGTGNPQYVRSIRPNSNGVGGCQRSLKAWGFLVGEALELYPGVAACSSGTAANYFQSQRVGGELLPAQQAYVGSDTELVTVSMGSDEVRFAELTTQCAHGVDGAIRNELGHALPHIRDCAHNAGLAHTLAAREAKLSVSLVKLYSDIALRMAPGGHLVVVGYPALWPAGGGRSCSFGNMEGNRPISMDWVTQKWMNAQVKQLNGVAAAAVAKATRPANGVTIDYADVLGAFGDHGFCGRFHRAWFNALSVRGRPFVQSPDDVLPNGCGERAYAFAVTTFLLEHYQLLTAPSRPCSDTQAIIK
jgi:hypothetical protein